MKQMNKNGSSLDKPHRWRFYRAGGFDQVRLDRGIDLVNLDQLNQKLWVALSCPTQGIIFDQKTLDLIDTDKDGRVRANELLDAVKWTCNLIRNPDELLKGSSELPLSSIDDSSPLGSQILSSAQQILLNLGKSGASAITLEDTADTKKIFATTQFNGDGIVPPHSTEDPEIQKVIEAIIATVGGETDRCGSPGVSTEKVEQFYGEAKAYSDWWAEAEKNPSEILPFGENSSAAKDLFLKLKGKIDDFFTRCQLAAFDSRAASKLNRDESVFSGISDKELCCQDPEIAKFPLATIEAGKSLPLKDGLNPAWADDLRAFGLNVVHPLLGQRDSLTQDEWKGIKVRMAAQESWNQKKPKGSVEGLGLETIRHYLSNGSRDAIMELIAKDKDLSEEADGIALVDRLIRFYRDIHSLANNFVNFRDFYDPTRRAVFQVGTLYLDGRSCDLCLSVSDVGKHSSMALLSGTYVAYCDCVRQGSNERQTIAAVFTDGDSDNLKEGRNGVFYDRRGLDWNATVTKLVDQPISIRQAFWSPYKKLASFVENQVEKFAASKDKAVSDQMASGVASASDKVASGTKTGEKPTVDIAKFAGIFAAIGLALSAIGTTIGMIATSFISLKPWQMPLAVLGVFLVISGPSMLLAALKLRKRNLAPVLDANGWAVNARARINIPFGTSLTQVASLPANSERSLKDPYADKRQPWKTYLFLVILLAAGYFLWDRGYLKQWYDQIRGQKATVEAPAEGADSGETAPEATAGSGGTP